MGPHRLQPAKQAPSSRDAGPSPRLRAAGRPSPDFHFCTARKEVAAGRSEGSRPRPAARGPPRSRGCEVRDSREDVRGTPGQRRPYDQGRGDSRLWPAGGRSSPPQPARRRCPGEAARPALPRPCPAARGSPPQEIWVRVLAAPLAAWWSPGAACPRPREGTEPWPPTSEVRLHGGTAALNTAQGTPASPQGPCAVNEARPRPPAHRRTDGPVQAVQGHPELLRRHQPPPPRLHALGSEHG